MNNFTHQYPAKQDFGGLIPNRPYARVRENTRLVHEHKIGFIPPVGGGSVTDYCKTVSVQYINTKINTTGKSPLRTVCRKSGFWRVGNWKYTVKMV